MVLYSVFVGQLSLGVTEKELHKLFSACGTVAEVFLAKVEETQTYRYGFVRYPEAEAAQEAIAAYNQWPLQGRKLVVESSKGGSQNRKSTSTTTRRLSDTGRPQQHQHTRRGPAMEYRAPFIPRRLKAGENADPGGRKRLEHLKQEAWEELRSVERVQLILHKLNDVDVELRPAFREDILSVQPCRLEHLETLLAQSKSPPRQQPTSPVSSSSGYDSPKHDRIVDTSQPSAAALPPPSSTAEQFGNAANDRTAGRIIDDDDDHAVMDYRLQQMDQTSQIKRLYAGGGAAEAIETLQIGQTKQTDMIHKQPHLAPIEQPKVSAFSQGSIPRSKGRGQSLLAWLPANSTQ